MTFALKVQTMEMHFPRIPFILMSKTIQYLKTHTFMGFSLWALNDFTKTQSLRSVHPV